MRDITVLFELLSSAQIWSKESLVGKKGRTCFSSNKRLLFPGIFVHVTVYPVCVCSVQWQIRLTILTEHSYLAGFQSSLPVSTRLNK